MVVLPSFPLKEVQSPVERHPACKEEAARHEREFAENESPLPIEALVTGDVPPPVKIPPSVVEPVPPKLTASVVVPPTTPVASVTRSELLILETVRFVVEAVPKYPVPLAERFVVDAFTKYEVEEAINPLWYQNAVVVACVLVPYALCVVNGQMN